MFQIPLATSASLLSRDDFWKSATIYHNRPHIVNRKIAVADQILFYEVESNSDITDVITSHALSYEVQRLGDVDKENLTEELIFNLLHTYDKNVRVSNRDIDALQHAADGVFLSVRIILPRVQKCSKCIELVVLDKNKDFVTFFSSCLDKDKLNPLPPFPYRLELTRDKFMRITLNNFEDADTSCAEWLFDSLFKKLMSWSALDEVNNGIQSLMKIPLQKYCQWYNNLKEKYGDPLRKVWWEKTKTDPQKFIFEDIAIASYLICLWLEEYKTEAKSAVKFVDCGCGNGLLVYILNREGYEGYGIDIRRRSVWDLFSEYADLQVGTISSDSTFPDATWLIGNHSDELTPWLPVIASRSSPMTNYFVLPCCPFDFSGKKYIRKNTKLSQYADYLEYIRQISDFCKFDTSVDKLRIPSTKRTCLIGLRKPYCNDISNICEEIDNFLKSKFESGKCYFNARPSVEKVRNCTQIDRNIRETLVKEIFNCLLSFETHVIRDDGTKWNEGGSIALKDLSRLIKKEYLNHLKCECGGLQTLLRNYRYIFEIKEGSVTLRKPFKLEETSQYKDKPCWYYKFHPDGCIYSDVVCGYSHFE